MRFLAEESAQAVIGHPVLARMMTYGLLTVVVLFMLVGLGRVIGLTRAQRKGKRKPEEE